MTPLLSSMTRRRILSTRTSSCVATTTVVPVRLIRSSSCMMPWLVCGSRFPVGSSAIRISGRLTKARATATRCCSPPESSPGRLSVLEARPTRSSTCGTWLATTWRGRPITSSAKATFSNTVLLGSNRKSWKTQPMLRRRYGHAPFRQVDDVATRLEDLPAASGSSSRSRSRMKVVLPEPDAPTRKTNSPFSISTVMSRRATVEPL